MRDALKLYAGRAVHVYFKTPGLSFRDESNHLCKQRGKKLINESWQVPDLKEGFSSWWRQVSKSYKFCCTSDAWLWDEHPGGFIKFELLDVPKPNKGQQQCFCEPTPAVSHCMLAPMLEWATDGADRALQAAANKPSKAAKKRVREWEARHEAVQAMLGEFEAGVPQDRLSEVANRLRCDIEVTLPFHRFGTEASLVEAKCDGKRLKKFQFINTRFDHVDAVNDVVCRQTPVELPQAALETMASELRERGEHHLFTTNAEGVSKIYTLSATYGLKDEYREVVSEWERAVGIDVGTFVYEGDDALYRFCWEGCRFNGCIDVRPQLLNRVGYRQKKKWYAPELESAQAQLDGWGLGHIDMERAYSNCHRCKYWEGVCFKLTDFRATDSVQGVGLYRCVRIDLAEADPGLVEVNAVLGGVYGEDAVLSSAEIAFLREWGVTLDVVAGCWGVGAVGFHEDKFLDVMSWRVITGKCFGIPYGL